MASVSGRFDINIPSYMSKRSHYGGKMSFRLFNQHSGIFHSGDSTNKIVPICITSILTDALKIIRVTFRLGGASFIDKDQ